MYGLHDDQANGNDLPLEPNLTRSARSIPIISQPDY